jgi:putative zinc finger protein
MVVNCEQVWQEVSNYLEGEVSPELRAAIEEHVRGCRRCTAVLDGTNNVVHLYGDERAVKLPAGFSARWQKRLMESIPGPRGTFYGWMVAVAAVALISGSFALARLSGPALTALRSEHAQFGANIPMGMMVAVSREGKTFHVPGCKYLHKHGDEDLRMVTVAGAIREGYVPCVRCLRQYVNR